MVIGGQNKFIEVLSVVVSRWPGFVTFWRSRMYSIVVVVVFVGNLYQNGNLLKLGKYMLLCVLILYVLECTTKNVKATTV